MTRRTTDATPRTYAGLDVSLKETAICVLDEAGKCVFEGTVSNRSAPDR
jgi:hypothetical protein